VPIPWWDFDVVMIKIIFTDAAKPNASVPLFNVCYNEDMTSSCASANSLLRRSMVVPGERL
jgi:hypothetical protein